MIYKISPEHLWHEAERAGIFTGASVDHQDGFIHFSTAGQVRETAAKHFAGMSDLLLIAVEESSLATSLHFEASRRGDMFPHLYGSLPLSAVVWVRPLPLGPNGDHIFPDLV